MFGAAYAVTNELQPAQRFLRYYSQRLADSFNALSVIQHNVTKGDTREYQILDTLRGLLPNRAFLQRDVIIVDSLGVQAPQTDLVAFDHIEWPLLLQDAGKSIVMSESVFFTIEVKSELNKSELDDIFKKSRDLRSMGAAPQGLSRKIPITTAFAYRCPNLNLSFFDFAVWRGISRELGADCICVLNQGVFGLVEWANGTAVPCFDADRNNRDIRPALFSTTDDSLLLYLWWLTRMTPGSSVGAGYLRQHSDSVFASLNAFVFDDDFQSLISADEQARRVAREEFMGTSSDPVSDVYSRSRAAVGL